MTDEQIASAVEDYMEEHPVFGVTASGWTTQEILMLELILKSSISQSDQTNNIAALVALL